MSFTTENKIEDIEILCNSIDEGYLDIPPVYILDARIRYLQSREETNQIIKLIARLKKFKRIKENERI